jgi:hypothetical protein
MKILKHDSLRYGVRASLGIPDEVPVTAYVAGRAAGTYPSIAAAAKALFINHTKHASISGQVSSKPKRPRGIANKFGTKYVFTKAGSPAGPEK